MASEFQVHGQSAAALFTLTVHRGEGMSLVAMNWKKGKPPANFVGFAIEYKEPGGNKFFALKNRLTLPGMADPKDPNRLSTLRSPIQKFRWVHFPRNANLPGEFSYKISPIFMNDNDELSYGETQEAQIELRRETYPGQLNVAFTRGFVSSQAFVVRYKTVTGILPGKKDDPLKFVPTNPQATDALAWMGFEAREAILDVLDKAIADPQAQVRVVAYDLNEPEVVTRMEKLGSRLKVIIDDSASHGKKGSTENEAAKRLMNSTGPQNVKREHMGSLQHNKFIAVNSSQLQLAVCGSTNFSWRAFFVQNNNAVVLEGKNAVKPFLAAFDNYWANSTVAGFAATPSVHWTALGLSGIDANVAFSPHCKTNALLQSVADDLANSTTSSLFYSLAFLYQTRGPIRDAITKITKNKQLFIYGISDRKVGGIVLQKPDGNLAAVYPVALTKNLPEPFKSEPTGGGGVRMHHKFLVIDFDKPTARVYLGSYNFSNPADVKNGENLLLIRDRRIAVSYLVEALSMFDHYHFRVAQQEAKKKKKRLDLAKPPRKPGEKAWWEEYYTDPRKIRDRDLFA
jgi:phosphatidylserine/phosphatidylglycerophosphate/cardiolipin synthase-like enzyme